MFQLRHCKLACHLHRRWPNARVLLLQHDSPVSKALLCAGSPRRWTNSTRRVASSSPPMRTGGSGRRCLAVSSSRPASLGKHHLGSSPNAVLHNEGSVCLVVGSLLAALQSQLKEALVTLSKPLVDGEPLLPAGLNDTTDSCLFAPVAGCQCTCMTSSGRSAAQSGSWLPSSSARRRQRRSVFWTFSADIEGRRRLPPGKPGPTRLTRAPTTLP